MYSGSCNNSSLENCTLYPWKEQCPPPKPWEPCPSDLTPLEIERKYEDAIVRIFTQTGLTTYESSVPGEPNLPPYEGLDDQDPSNTFDTYCTFGNGFRIKNGLIVCPAHLVLLPPNLMQLFTVYPGIQPIDVRADGNTIQRVGRILIDVFNVNGSGYSFTYEAHIFAVDGACDVAILYIPDAESPYASNFNAGLPIIKKCHPYLTFGCSRTYRNTEPAYVLGDTSSVQLLSSINQGGSYGGSMNFSSRGILSTTVNSYRHADYTGFVQPEMIILNGNAYASSGAPILDKYGHVIGIQTLSTPGTIDGGNSRTGRSVGNGVVGGPSQFSMMRSLTLMDQAIRGCFVPQIETIEDDYTKTVFYLLNHGYLGVAWDLVTGANFGSYINNENGFQIPFLLNDGSWFSDGPQKKHIVGMRVRALAGQMANKTEDIDQLVKYIAVPGATPNDSPYYINFVDSPLLQHAKPNDIIYDFNCMPIGDIGVQAAPSLAIWSLSPGSEITMKIREFKKTEDSFDNDKKVTVKLAKMPNWVNFPWYKYPDLPVTNLFGNYFFALEYQLPVLPVLTGLQYTESQFFPSI